VRQRSISNDLIYSSIICFLMVFMSSLHSVFATFCIKTKVVASAAMSGFTRQVTSPASSPY
jgi:hypothetical protein